MLIVLPFCSKDAHQAEKLLHWMAELDGCQEKHQMLLVAARGMPVQERSPVLAVAKLAFSKVNMVQTTVEDNRPWPEAPNTMFRAAARYVTQVYQCPFWWHEPDCVPLSPGWLSALEAEYVRAARPFMGCVVHKPCTHLTGCAIYPPFPENYNHALLYGPSRVAFDCIAPERTLPHAHNTNLFHHQWSDPTGPDVPTFPTQAKLSIINKGAVVFHRCKDGTLIDRLRERRNAPVAVEASRQANVDAKREIERLRLKPNRTDEEHARMVELRAKQPKRPFLNKGAKRGNATHQPRQKFLKNCLKIYTYYDRVAGQPSQDTLIAAWRAAWEAQGWQPVILSRTDAQACLQFNPYFEAINKLPTVNSREYENACYLRHLAMVQVGGGFLVDYDVFPRAFTPIDYRVARADRGLVIFEPTRVPCAIAGGQAGFQQVVDLIRDYKVSELDKYAGRSHTSDMEILRKSKIHATNHCVEHLCSGSTKRDDPGDGWRTAPMIHFSTYSFHKLGIAGKGQKHEWIGQVLADLNKHERTKTQIHVTAASPATPRPAI